MPNEPMTPEEIARDLALCRKWQEEGFGAAAVLVAQRALAEVQRLREQPVLTAIKIAEEHTAQWREENQALRGRIKVLEEALGSLISWAQTGTPPASLVIQAKALLEKEEAR